VGAELTSQDREGIDKPLAAGIPRQAAKSLISHNLIQQARVPFPGGHRWDIFHYPKAFQVSGDFGFFDQTDNGGTKYTQLALNPDNPSQSNGLIFRITDEHYTNRLLKNYFNQAVFPL
jgi:hypothetical protein